MPDRKTIIAALEYCAVGTRDCHGCPMKDGCKGVSNGAMAAAARLLKEQEPVEPIRQWDDDETTWWYSCGSCVQAVDYKDKFCRHCGKGLKWDD